jgi:hypothetical protein
MNDSQQSREFSVNFRRNFLLVQICRIFSILNWDLSYSLAPQAQKLLPGEKLAKIFDF